MISERESLPSLASLVCLTEDQMISNMQRRLVVVNQLYQILQNLYDIFNSPLANA